SETKGIIVTVDEQENIFVNGSATTREQLGEGLRQAVESSDVKRVVLQGDKAVLLGDVVYILDEARAAGASEVAIAATRREEARVGGGDGGGRGRGAGRRVARGADRESRRPRGRGRAAGRAGPRCRQDATRDRARGASSRRHAARDRRDHGGDAGAREARG